MKERALMKRSNPTVFLLNALVIQLWVREDVVRGIGVGLNIGNGAPAVGLWVGDGDKRAVSPTSSPSPGVSSAYEALQAWKAAIVSDPNNVLNSWVGDDVCSYKGLFCGDGATVVGIDLNGANLEGSLVSELSFFADLVILHLNSNRFSGTVPDSFSNLLSLQELDLSNNNFSGAFPTVSLQIPILLYLDLRFNAFSGPLPTALFNNKLDAIFLNNNNFLGEIPQSLGNSQASVISLANNNLTGSLPVNFGWTNFKLKEILLLNNQLTGCIPLQIGLFSQLEVLDLSFNSFTGRLPDSLSCLNMLEVLNLEHNLLTGEVPNVICSIKSLMNLTIAFNFFTKFSQQCEKLFSTNSGFDLSLNCFPGIEFQRPSPQCSAVSGGVLNCLRIPLVQPLVCNGLFAGLKTNLPLVP